MAHYTTKFDSIYHTFLEDEPSLTFTDYILTNIESEMKLLFPLSTR